jgi:hypothetical protein
MTRRLALALLLLLTLAAPSQATSTYSNLTTRMDDASSPNQALAYTSSVTTGHDLIVFLGIYNVGSAGVTWSCTNSVAGSLTQRTQSPASSATLFNTAIFTQHNVTGGSTTITCSQSAGDAYFSMVMIEMTGGFDETAPFEVSSSSNSSGTSTATGNLVTTAASRLFAITYYETAGTITEVSTTSVFENETTQLNVVTVNVGATTTNIGSTLSANGNWWSSGISYLDGSCCAAPPAVSGGLLLRGVGE